MNHRPQSAALAFVAFQIWFQRSSAKQVCQLAHSCLLRPTRLNMFRAFLDLILGWSKKHWANTNTKRWTNSFWSRLFHKKEPLSEAVSRLKTSPKPCLLEMKPARSNPSTLPGRYLPWHRFQLTLVHFHPPNFLQFETHFPFIFVLWFCDFLRPTWKECGCHVGVGLHLSGSITSATPPLHKSKSTALLVIFAGLISSLWLCFELMQLSEPQNIWKKHWMKHHDKAIKGSTTPSNRV